MVRPKMYSAEQIIEMGEELLKCMNEPGVYHVTEFSERKKKCPSWVYELAKDYDVFGEYFTRARNILGRKYLRKAMDESPDRWTIKTIMKRYLDLPDENLKQWIKEDIEEEAMIKAEAAKAANLTDIDPRVVRMLELLEKKPSVRRDEQ